VGRTTNAVRNSGFAASGQILSVLLGFASRTVFIHILGVEYLGVHGVFTNILAILSFAELGVGTAMTYAMYRPLASGDEGTVAALMNAYARAYRFIGIIVGVLGLMLAPFLGVLMKDLPDIPNLLGLYFVFLLNSVLTYFLSYSRSLLIASQNGHLDVLNRTAFLLLQNVFQIVILFLTQDYMLYLGVQVVSTVASNLVVTRQVRRKFPNVLDQKGAALDGHVRIELRRNVSGMVFHKFGSAAVATSTTLFISAFVGVAAVGLYSNYVLIVGMITGVIAQAIAAVAPSVGNLNATGAPAESAAAFEKLFFINFLVVGGATAALAVLLNPFIAVWIGQQYVLDPRVTAVVIVNFFLYGMRQTAITFINASGLFWAIRFKSLLEAVVSVVASVILLVIFDLGVFGALLSVTISTLATNIWWEPLVVWRKVFARGLGRYLRLLFAYSLATLVSTGVSVGVASHINLDGVSGLVASGLGAMVLTSGCFLIIFRRDPSLKYVKSLCRIYLRRRR
jgi:O-antigen/teichoic acid export membrane protein